MFSHKFNDAGLTYEVAISIFNGMICWINGPFKSSYGDKMIFIEGLGRALLHWEYVHSDKGYRHNDSNCEDEEINELCHKLLYKGLHESKQDCEEIRQMRARQEIIHSLFKDFNVLCTKFRCNGSLEERMEKHGICFFAVAVVVQFLLQEGNPWQPDYNVVYHNYPPPDPEFVKNFYHYRDSSEEEDEDDDSTTTTTTTSSDGKRDADDDHQEDQEEDIQTKNTNDQSAIDLATMLHHSTFFYSDNNQ
jgi:hypothetical protein